MSILYADNFDFDNAGAFSTGALAGYQPLVANLIAARHADWRQQGEIEACNDQRPPNLSTDHSRFMLLPASYQDV